MFTVWENLIKSRFQNCLSSPRWKIKNFEEYEGDWQQMIVDAWNDNYKPTEQDDDVDPSLKKLMDRYGYRGKQCELQDYLNVGASPPQRYEKNNQPHQLAYWRSQEHRWPNLAVMARDYLAIPATSTPSERCFSNARLVLPYTRNRLLPSKVRQLMLLDSWIDQI